MITYRQRANLLHQTKIKHSKEKTAQLGFVNSDDHGGIPMPESFHFEPITDRPNVIYGAKGFSVNLAKFWDECPLYVDPVEILAGRHTRMMLEASNIPWGAVWPEFIASYNPLKENQKKYNIISGIGANNHFAPDYNIGMQLGFPGLLAKIEHYRALNDASHY